MRRTPEELHNLAEAEKEKAIDLLNSAHGINTHYGFENNVIREAVECIIKATMLYNSEIHTESLNELLGKREGGKKI